MTKKELNKEMKWVKNNIHNQEEFADKIKSMEVGIYAVIAFQLGFEKFKRLSERVREGIYNMYRDNLLKMGLITPLDFGPAYTDCEVFSYEPDIFEALAEWAFSDAYQIGWTPIYGDEEGNVWYGERIVLNA